MPAKLPRAPDVRCRAMKRGLATGLCLVAVVLLVSPAANARNAKPSTRCDFTDPAVCLYPWPNDLLTKRDKTTPTGRRLALRRASMPRNKTGRPIDPTDMNRADGFSPGSMLVVKIPGLDNAAALQRSHLPSLANLAASLGKHSPV